MKNIVKFVVFKFITTHKAYFYHHCFHFYYIPIITYHFSNYGKYCKIYYLLDLLLLTKLTFLVFSYTSCWLASISIFHNIKKLKFVKNQLYFSFFIKNYLKEYILKECT